MLKRYLTALLPILFMHPVSAELTFTPVQPEVFADAGGQSNAWGDFDNDGDLDLIVTFNRAPVRLYRNTPDGFENVAPGSGLPTDDGNPRSSACTSSTPAAATTPRMRSPFTSGCPRRWPSTYTSPYSRPMDAGPKSSGTSTGGHSMAGRSWSGQDFRSRGELS